MTEHRKNRIRPRQANNLWSRLTFRASAGGQALIEYVLIIVLVTIAIIAVLAITGPAVGNVFSNTVYNLLGGTVQPRSTLSADEFWEQVAAVASYTPESPKLITNTPAPSTAVPTARPTLEPSDIPPSLTPTNTVTPGPSPTPPDHDFGYPFDDPGNDPDWWEHDFGGPFDDVTWDAEYWDMRDADGGAVDANMNATKYGVGKGKYRETLGKIDKAWGTARPASNVTKNFYARFTTKATFEAIPYTLRVKKDDGVRIWIGGVLVVDQWSWAPKYGDWFDTAITPTAGTLDVKVELYDNSSGAEIHVVLIGGGTDQGDCNWAISNEEFHSSPTSWSDSPGTDYDPGSYCTLQLRGFIDLRTASRPTLEFWDRYALSSNAKVWVGVSVYDSGEWTDVLVHSGDTNLGWSRQTFDLSNFGATATNFIGKMIELRFILDAKSSTSAADGWWLDDIQVEQEVIRRYTVGFSDDMEGASHWYPGGSWALSNEQIHSGGKAWSDSPGRFYEDDSDSYLELDGLVDMADPLVADPELTFWHRYNLVDTDKIGIEISTDRITWTELKPLATSTSNLSWTQQVISLGAQKGSEFYLRFRLDARLNSAVADGWWIDDFSLRNRVNTTITLDWCDNMEIGGGNWLPDGKWGVVSGPDINGGANNSNQTISAHSGSQYWSDSPRTDYEHSTSSSLQLKPNIDLTGAQNPEMVFWHQWDLADSDDLIVEVSENGGEDWNTVWSYLYGGKPAGYGSIWDDNGFDTVLSWTREAINLKTYANKTIHVRFRIDALINPGVDDGWWVDDVCFQEYNQPVRSLPFRDGFERGSGSWFEGGTWAIVPENKRTGAVGYSDSYGSDYKHWTNAILELRGAIDLRGSVKPTLYFWDAFEIETGDFAVVEINSSADGVAWSGWNTVYSHDEGNRTGSWDRRAVNLDSYKTKLIRIRFRLYAVRDWDVGKGWWLDDVSVIERNGVETLHALPFFEDAESSSGYWVLEGNWSRISTQRGLGSGSELGPGGWTGEYLASDPAKCSQPIITNATLVGTRTDEEIAFDFDGNKPFGMVDCFIVRWKRAIYVPSNDTTYQIQTHSDDGIRVWVDMNKVGSTPNEQRVIDRWVNRSYSQDPDVATVTLSQGFHNVRVEYFENSGGADVDVDFTLQGMVFHDSPTGTYYKYDDASVMLEGMIDLTGTTTPALTYWEKRALGSNHTIYTEISTDEGFTWKVLKQKYGNDNTWRKQLIDLTAYAGKKINIRFRLDARSNQTTADGWYIDDILVAE